MLTASGHMQPDEKQAGNTPKRSYSGLVHPGDSLEGQPLTSKQWWARVVACCQRARLGELPRGPALC